MPRESPPEDEPTEDGGSDRQCEPDDHEPLGVFDPTALAPHEVARRGQMFVARADAFDCAHEVMPRGHSSFGSLIE